MINSHKALLLGFWPILVQRINKRLERMLKMHQDAFLVGESVSAAAAIRTISYLSVK